MVDFKRTCKYCFGERGEVILLVEAANGEYICPKNPAHKVKEEVIIVA